MSPIPVHTWWHYRPARTLPEGPSLLPFVRCRCPEQVLGSRREVTAQAGSCQTGLCVAAIKSGVFVYPARGAENQGSFLGVTWPASPRQGWEPWGGDTHTPLPGPCHARHVPSTGAALKKLQGPSSSFPVLGSRSRGRRHPHILPPPTTCAGSCIVLFASCPFPPPSHCVRPQGPLHARSSWAVAASSLPGVGVGASADGAAPWGGFGSSPGVVREPMPCRKTPCEAGEEPVPCAPWGGWVNDPRDWASPGSFWGRLQRVSGP